MAKHRPTRWRLYFAVTVLAMKGCSDSGAVIDADDASSTPPSCGDGVVDEGEACDAGAANDDSAACKSDCSAQRCGDGFVGPAEGCDDGNSVDDDGCTNGCALPTCGDMIVHVGEACDDGNDRDNDDCLTTCVAPSCGDGHAWQGEEECDQGSGNADEGACKSDCTLQACRDGFVGPGEDCDDGNEVDDDDTCTNACTIPECGDAIKHANETCDDGNDVGDDGCSNRCELSAKLLWQRSLPRGTDVAVDSSDAIIVAGNWSTTGGDATWLRKFDAAGTELWTRFHYSGGLYGAVFRAMAIDEINDDIVVTGGSASRPFVARYDASGNERWDRLHVDNVKDPLALDIALDSAGNIFTSGRIDGAGSYDVFLRKHSPTGGIVWTATYDGDSTLGIGNGVVIDGLGNPVAVGWSNTNAWVGKYDTSAGLLWEKSYDGGANDIAEAVAVDASNNVAVAGISVSAGQVDILLVKYDATGNALWARTHDGPDGANDYGEDVAIDSAGNIVIVGTVRDGDQGDAFFAKYAPNGDLIWTTTYPGMGNITGDAVAIDSNDNVIVLSSDGSLRKYAP